MYCIIKISYYFLFENVDGYFCMSRIASQLLVVKGFMLCMYLSYVYRNVSVYVCIHIYSYTHVCTPVMYAWIHSYMYAFMYVLLFWIYVWRYSKNKLLDIFSSKHNYLLNVKSSKIRQWHAINTKAPNNVSFFFFSHMFRISFAYINVISYEFYLRIFIRKLRVVMFIYDELGKVCQRVI